MFELLFIHHVILYTSAIEYINNNIESEWGSIYCLCVDDEDENSNVDDSEKHMKSLIKLKEMDPDFYKFLEENDKKLLEFKDSEEESESEDEETETIHKPPEKLEVIKLFWL